MLETDNETEARKAAERFGFPGVRHFYDDKNHVGGVLMAEQFPNAIRDALEILPADSPMREKLESKRNLPPEKIPLWDSVLVFRPDVRWEDRSPKPSWWTRQTGSRVEEKRGEPKVVFWKNGRPLGSDWYLEAREALEVASAIEWKWLLTVCLPPPI